MNPTFSRTFKKECGNSVISYINNLRINKAKELLATSNLKLLRFLEVVEFTTLLIFPYYLRKYRHES